MDTSWDNVEGTTRSQMLLRLPQVSRLSDIELPNKYHFFKLLLKHPRDQKKKKKRESDVDQAKSFLLVIPCFLEESSKQ